MHGALTHLCGRVPCEKCHPKEIRATNGVARIPSYGSGVGTSSLPPLQALGKLESLTMWPREGSESSYWVEMFILRNRSVMSSSNSNAA